MALVSPGVQVSITDESFFSSSGPGTVPLIMIATKQDKLTPDGSGIAPGTTAANADKLYLVSSQRELLQTFGDPDFNEIGGTAQNGYPLNEFGLLAAYSYLGAANRAYVVRADVDLAELEPTSVEPTTSPADDSYWLDTSSTTAGLFAWTGTAWAEVSLSVITSATTIVSLAEPSSGYQAGDQAINFTNDGGIYYVERASDNSVWELMGSGAQRATTDFQWGPNAAEPSVNSDGDPLVVGDLWLKTPTNGSSPNNGLDITLSHYDSGLGQIVTDTVAEIADNHATYYSLTSVTPSSVPAGTIVGFIDSTDSFGDTTGDTESRPHGGLGTGMVTSEADIVLEIHNGNSTVVKEGTTTTTLVYAAGSDLTVNGTLIELDTGNSPGEAAGTYLNLNDLIIFINTGLPAGVVASLNTVGDGITLTEENGNDLVITLAGGATPDLGLGAAGPTTYSNFEALSTSTLVGTYVASTTAPTGTVADGTYWYDPSFNVDLLVNAGNGSWVDAPTAGTLYVQSDDPGAAADGSIWVETDDVANYPVIYRRVSGAWVLVDNTDQTSSNGIVFADARVDPNQAANNLDSDAPDPLLYPGGTLLWNTRYSGRNVKVWTENAVTSPSYTDADGRVWGLDRWVSASGNAVDGSLITGQDAQKAVVVEKLAEVLIGNEAIRDDTIFYNLIASPGFPELIDEMITLNVDRKEQAFVIGDSPFSLSNSTTALQAWSSNSAGAASNGDDGLVTADTYLGVYYPSGLSTNVDGNEVVVPASHMVLRVMAQNDQTAYPWYAPAGFSRGTVTNATSVGYLNSSDEFVPVSLTQGQRDTLQQNNVNPIANIPNRGLVVFGQKTRQSVASALDRVNVARLVNYIRFQADQLAQPFLFEPNDTVTRGAVKDAFDSFLAGLVTLRGLNDFLVVVDESNNTPARIDNNELWIDIAIQPIKSVEFIFIPIRIRNTGDDLNL